MADQNKLLIEIVLDDGSVKQGFATIKQEAKKAAKETEKEFKNFGDVFDAKPLDALNDRIRKLPVSFGVAAAAATGLGLSIKKAFDFTLEGEKIKGVENAFASLAQNAGLNAGQLESQLQAAAGGLADTTDILEASNRSIAALGENAKRLPQVLSVARQVSTVFGKDLKDAYETLSVAIVTGNEKALKNVNVFIDLDKAVKEYAKSLGLSVESLNEQEKQQARLNAILQFSEKGFAGVDASALQTTKALKQLQNAGKDLIDNVLVGISNAFGPAFASTLKAIAGGINLINNSIKANDSSIGGASAQISLYQSRLASLDAQLAQGIREGNEVFVASIKQQSDAIRAQISLLEDRKKAFEGGFEDPRQRAQQNEADFNRVKDLLARQAEERKKAGEKSLAEEVAFQQALTQAQAQGEQARYEAIIASTTELDQLDAQTAMKVTQIEFDRQQAVLNIQKQFQNSKVVSLQEYRTLVELTNQAFDNRELAAQAEHEQKKKDLVDKANKYQAEANKAYQSFVLNSFTQGFSALGAALVKGEDAFAAFAKTVLGVMGDFAIQMGGILIAQGLAIDALKGSLLSLNGGAAVAAGAALVTLGGALKALSGGMGGLGGSGSSVDVGGGIAVQPTTEIDDNAADVAERVPGTEVVVNIQGDVLDSDDTGIRIVDIINSAFDRQGVKIRRGAVV